VRKTTTNNRGTAEPARAEIEVALVLHGTTEMTLMTKQNEAMVHTILSDQLAERWAWSAWSERWDRAASLRADLEKQGIAEDKIKASLKQFHLNYLAAHPEARAPDASRPSRARLDAHPKAGASKAEPKQLDFKPLGICWHCEGTRKCNCISCDKGVCAVCGSKGERTMTNEGNPEILYIYYLEHDGQNELRTINEHHLFARYAGQEALESFLRTRCTKVEFIDKMRFMAKVADDRVMTVKLFSTPELDVKIEAFRQTPGFKVSRFFEEGTDWLETAPCLDVC
jgi:hypothetical protein